MRILVVEDERLIARSLRKGLEQERYAVDLAYDGTEGYDLASTEDYDAIILDRMIPGMDGMAVCRAIRKDKKTVPILMLTAKGQVHERVEGLDAGADDYLTKPFSFEELLARLRAILRRPSEAVGTVLTVHDLTLDPQTFAVSRAGEPIKLSVKEYALLEYLMRNAGKVLHKDQITMHVWDYDADILPNTVEVYIKNLRSKIDVPYPKKPALIQTVRGFGYKIAGPAKA